MQSSTKNNADARNVIPQNESGEKHMKPKKLTLCGWGPYKSIEEVDFTVFEEKGTFLITGATGSGKTTIFDAISYALYGALRVY